MSVEPVYLDYNATTPLCYSVIRMMKKDMKDFWYNPNSTYGTSCADMISFVEDKIIKILCPPTSDTANTKSRLVFTSGATESNVMVISAIAHGCYGKGHKMRPLVITSQLEHASIIETLEYFEHLGMIDVYWMPVHRNGTIDLSGLCESEKDSLYLEDRPFILGCLMLANNETGVIQPVSEFSQKLRTLVNGSESMKAHFAIHSDISQAVGKIPIDINKLGVDTCAFTGHKFYAPKGIGGLIINSETMKTFIRDHPLIHGCGQQHNLRSGTEPLTLILSLAYAIEAIRQR